MQRKLGEAAGSMGRSVGLCAMLAIAIVGASNAQESCVSRDLVRGVMGGDFGKLFVGASKPEVVQGIPLPSDATPLGGAEHDRGVTVVATVPRPTASPSATAIDDRWA